MSIDSSPTIPETVVEVPSATVPTRRSIVYLAGALAGGNVISLVLRTVGVVLQGRFVEPAVLGLFGELGLVLGYIPFLQLGILNGLNRELPYFVGKGDHERVKELAAAAQAWAIGLGLVVGVLMLPLAGWYFAQGDLWRAAGWTTNVILAFLFFYGSSGASYLQVTYRTGHDFARLALANVLQNGLTLVLLVLVAFFGFYGLCLRALLAAGAASALLFFWRPVRVAPKWNLGHLKHLLIIGAPIFGVGQLYAWWAVLNLTLVATYGGGAHMYGLYMYVFNAGLALDSLPLAVSQVLYPRMAERYGRTGKLQGLAGMTVKPVILTVLGMTAVIVMAQWVVGPFFRLVLPAYVDAVPAIRWAMLASFVNSFYPLTNVFNVVRRQDLYVVPILLGMATYGGCLLWLVHGGVTLVAFPQAMLAGQTVFMVLCYVLVLYLVRKERAVT
jgi:O-antigen/teichoic acid export membrane protein